jgi:transposase
VRLWRQGYGSAAPLSVPAAPSRAGRRAPRVTGRCLPAVRLRRCTASFLRLTPVPCCCLAVSPRRRRLALYLQLRPRALDGLDVGIFLVYLLRHIRGRIVLLWDQGSIHRRREVTLFLRQHPRVRVEEFPSYAPELNPAEFLWTQGDRSLANSAPADLADIRQMLRRSYRKIRGSQRLLWSCIFASDLPWGRQGARWTSS